MTIRQSKMTSADLRRNIQAKCSRKPQVSATHSCNSRNAQRSVFFSTSSGRVQSFYVFNGLGTCAKPLRPQPLNACLGTRDARIKYNPVAKPLNILSVDDEFRVAHALSFALSNSERKLTLAFSADEALAKVSNHSEPFDLVIIDHKMPRVSGIELVQRLRAAQFGGKIVVLSAHLTDENRRAYAELNVNMMITKPFDVHELRGLVDSLARVA
jgi:CheY-like chemotaxis protein